MKHARKDYDRIQDPDGKIPADEPVFLLRGQDAAAPGAVRAWIREAVGLGADFKLIEAAALQAAHMDDWQAEHVRKVPDAEPDVLARTVNFNVRIEGRRRVTKEITVTMAEDELEGDWEQIVSDKAIAMFDLDHIDHIEVERK